MNISSRRAQENPKGRVRLIYGIHPVEEALLSGEGKVQKIWIAYGRSGDTVNKLASRARDLRIPVAYKDRKALDHQTNSSRHQGIVALLADVDPLSLEEILARERRGNYRLLLLLDRIQDPRNLGAIIRTANSAGVDGIILTRHRSASITPAVAKASAGALETMPLATVANVTHTIKTLKTKGIWVFGAEPRAEMTVYQADFQQDICIVIGGEGKGLGQLVKQHCDFLIRIPRAGGVTSLNVSVAAGVLLYEVYRQRLVLNRDAEG
jgi:23S rRNA (guanosine2251-2'-O)-methyltransferase